MATTAAPQRAVTRLAGRGPARRGSRVATRVKKDIHPQFYKEAKVYVNGEEVMTTAGPLESYDVDIWSGNHPFYQGKIGAVVQDEGQVESFKNKYSELEDVFGVNADNANLSDLLGKGGSSDE